MSNEVLFHEEQRFRQPWLWVFLPAICLVTILPQLYGFYQQWVLKKPWGNHPMSDAGLLALVSVMLLFWIGLLTLFIQGRLITEVREDGLYLRFIPFHFSFLRFPWSDLRSWEAVTYNPLLDYGGWGIRYGFNGRAYNVSGNRGVRLIKRDGGKLMVGSQRAELLAQALDLQSRRSGR